VCVSWWLGVGVCVLGPRAQGWQLCAFRKRNLLTHWPKPKPVHELALRARTPSNGQTQQTQASTILFDRECSEISISQVGNFEIQIHTKSALTQPTNSQPASQPPSEGRPQATTQHPNHLGRESLSKSIVCSLDPSKSYIAVKGLPPPTAAAARYILLGCRSRMPTT
jgi:hypothetical protein